MTKYLLAATAVALSAFAATAAETPVRGVALGEFVATATETPVVMTGAPMMVSTPVGSMPTQTARRGLFGRMRGRNTTPAMTTTLPTTTMTMTPVMTAPVMTTTAMAMPAPTTTTVTTAGAAPATMATPQVPGGIVMASGTTATESMVMPAAYTEPVMSNTMSNTTSTRRGLFGRLRNR